MRARMLASAAAMTVAFPASAQAVVSASGTSSRLPNGRVAVTVTNTGTEEIRFLRLSFGAAYAVMPQSPPCQGAAPGEVFCPLAPGALPPGGRLTVEHDATPAFPDGTPIAGRASADGVTDVQFQIPGPAPSGPDIAVDLTGPATALPGATVRYTLTIANVGKAMAAGGQVRVAFPNSGTLGIARRFGAITKDPRAGEPITGEDLDDDTNKAEVLTVPFPALAPGGRTQTTVDVEIYSAAQDIRALFGKLIFDDVGTRSLQARLLGPDPEPGPNADTLTTAYINGEPRVDSAIGRRAATPREISGTATGKASGVEVAVVRATDGARAAAPTCSWLASTRGTFRRTPVIARRCRSPIWLKASGTKRWKLQLTRPLPRGSYVVYSRAVTSDDAHEVRFSAKDGNRLALRVR